MSIMVKCGIKEDIKSVRNNTYILTSKNKDKFLKLLDNEIEKKKKKKE